jgi:hypothetical protein
MGLWMLLTALLLTRAHSAWASFIWLAGLQATYAAWLLWAASKPWGLEAYALGAAYWAPLACIAVGCSARVERSRPELAATFEEVGWVELVLCASLGTCAFYGDMRQRELGGLWLGLAVSALLSAWLWMRLPAAAWRGTARGLLLVALLLGHLPLLLSPGDLDVLAALSFMGLWLLVAVTAHRAGQVPLLNLATAVLGLRIVIVYFEVFGSLLDTGVGLLSGGLLTVGLAWLWMRKRRDFERGLAGARQASG